jgi:hypothetical protein
VTKEAEIKEEKYFIESDFDHRTMAKVLVCAPTGLFYSVQAGGGICAHPYVEGYVIDLLPWQINMCLFEKKVEEFNDCEIGCCLPSIGKWLEEDNPDPCVSDIWITFESPEKWQEYAKEYGKEIDIFLENNVNNWNRQHIKFAFDYERAEEVMEGWWPVLVYFPLDTWFMRNTEEKYSPPQEGYLHLGNCD